MYAIFYCNQATEYCTGCCESINKTPSFCGLNVQTEL